MALAQDIVATTHVDSIYCQRPRKGCITPLTLALHQRMLLRVANKATKKSCQKKMP